jgi:hypothetical protein
VRGIKKSFARVAAFASRAPIGRVTNALRASMPALPILPSGSVTVVKNVSIEPLSVRAAQSVWNISRSFALKISKSPRKDSVPGVNFAVKYEIA